MALSENFRLSMKLESQRWKRHQAVQDQKTRSHIFSVWKGPLVPHWQKSSPHVTFHSVTFKMEEALVLERLLRFKTIQVPLLRFPSKGSFYWVPGCVLYQTLLPWSPRTEPTGSTCPKSSRSPQSSLRPAIREEAQHGRSANITEPINFLLHESELRL